MPSSTPSSVSRYRPAILVLTGAAAAYTAYLIYNTVQAAPSDGLQRSNAVRRRAARRRDSPSARALSLRLARNSSDLGILGEYSVYGTSVPLDPHNLVSVAELRAIIANADPDASTETVDNTIAGFYDFFLDQLLAFLPRSQPQSPAVIQAVQEWVGPHIPDATAVSRAAERHAQNPQSLPILPGHVPVIDGAESVAPTEMTWESDDDAENDAMDPDGQTLQRTLYHIAEDRARLEGVLHRGITCNGCDEKPIRGTRWHCANCVDFDLCSNCEATNSHDKTHIFYKIRVPAPYLGLPKQEPLYPGKPHMMSPSIESSLKKRLVSETRMEAEEIEALWDQFTCLAATEWPGDTSGVGWALDRRAFNFAFVPRYNSFVAAPNLIYDRIFDYYDTDKNGLIGFDEWIKGLDLMHTNDQDVKARIVFSGYDINGDGYISRKDVLRIFRAYYAIEKEAARNHIAELTEELSVRNALETIRSSQPLGSAFSPHNMATSNAGNLRLRRKQQDEDLSSSPVIQSNDADVAAREEMLKATDLQSVVPGEISPSEQNHIVTNRWARRQFYLDEEEGLTRPEGADVPDTSRRDQDDGNLDMIEEGERPSFSRSSSRVRFQDDVDMETRSNASTSSRPVGERWGGYEVPEPEKDLGKEVLYQITQQGFNELLNPLFLEKEDMAMDVFETRSERRNMRPVMTAITEELFTTSKTEIEGIVGVGFFRYTKCVVDQFCKALNDGHPTFKSFFQTTSGGPRTREQALSVITNVYSSAEHMVVNSIKTTNPSHLDNMTLYDAALCRRQLQEEALDAILNHASILGWLSDVDLSEVPPETYRDPTMPQFRPNSLAQAATVPDETSPSDSTSVEGDSDTDGSSLFVQDIETDQRWFVNAMPDLMETISGGRPLANGDDMLAQEPSPTDATSDPSVVEPPSTNPASSQTALDVVEPIEQLHAINWRLYTDNPEVHSFHVRSVNGLDVISSSSKPIVHSENPYHPETNPLKPLQHQVRQSAMNPNSPLHPIVLSSLEYIDQEIYDRKGSGLISFDEFAEHMRQGRLRFLESWLEWVSI